MHFASRRIRRSQHRLLPAVTDRAAPPRSPLPGPMPCRNPLGDRSPLPRRALAQRQLRHAFWIERKPVPVWDAVRARRIP